MSEQQERGGAQVVVAGGGIAGLEAVLALRHLAPELEVTLLAPEPEFFYKPLVVEEPFTNTPAERRALAPAMAELGAGLIVEGLKSVDPNSHTVELGDGSALAYERLVVCVGGRAHPAYAAAETFWSSAGDLPVDALIERAAKSDSATLALIVPPGTSWPLPLYELALMLRSRAEERGFPKLRIDLLTPEDAPLLVFGKEASTALEQTLRARGIEIEAGTHVLEDPDGRPVRMGAGAVEAGAFIALPTIEGPAVAGLPADAHGFIPVDQFGRVRNVEHVYAAGDGTDFPVKQGGLATQQADACVTDLAASLGAPLEPEPFRPVLRGQLITGTESLNLRHVLTGGAGEGTVSLDYLWWPPQKVGGRFLSAWLAHVEPQPDLELPMRPLEVEVSWPHEWHGELGSYDAEVRIDP